MNVKLDLLGGQNGNTYNSLILCRNQQPNSAEAKQTAIETGPVRSRDSDGVAAASVFGIVAPAGTPQPVVEQLNRAINDGLKNPDVREGFAKLGVEPNPGSVRDFSDFIAGITPRWTEIVRITGIKVGG